jgi:hypothetical protein
MENEFKKVISSLALVESEFRRNGFDKQMGKNACLYVALANRIICAVDDLNDIRSKQEFTIAKEVRKRVAEIEKKLMKDLGTIKKEVDRDIPSVKVIPKATKKATKKAKVKVQDE